MTFHLNDRITFPVKGIKAKPFPCFHGNFDYRFLRHTNFN